MGDSLDDHEKCPVCWGTGKAEQRETEDPPPAVWLHWVSFKQAPAGYAYQLPTDVWEAEVKGRSGCARDEQIRYVRGDYATVRIENAIRRIESLSEAAAGMAMSDALHMAKLELKQALSDITRECGQTDP